MAVKKIETLNKHQNPATNENEFDIENYMNVNWDKIKEVVDNNADELTTTQGKVTTLETDNTNNKADIQELQSKNEEQDEKIEAIETKQTTQNDLIERTKDALINITTPKSSNINVKDSSDLNAKVDVYGTSSQETSTQGNNYFDIERANFQKGAIGEDGKTIISNSDNYYTENYIELDKAKYYLYEVEANDYNKVCVYDSDKNQTRQISVRGTSKETSIEIDLAENEKYIRMHYYTTETTNRKIMLSKDSAKDYEEFSPDMPSTKYPSDIENAGDNINLFDGELELGFIDGTGAVTSDSNCIRSKNFIDIKENETYTISNDKNYSNILFAYDESKELISNLGDVSTFKTPKNTKYIKFRSSSGQKENNLSVKYKIEKGNKATSYSPYKCGNIDITVCNKNFVGGKWIIGYYNSDGLYNSNNLYRCIKKFLKAGTYVYSLSANLYRVRAVNLSNASDLTIDSNNSFTLEEDAEISLAFRKQDSSAWDLGENLSDVKFQLEKGSTPTAYAPHEQQTITFPLQEGQKLYKGDYLADDGIHHVRKQEKLLNKVWNKYNTTDSKGNTFGFSSVLFSTPKQSNNTKDFALSNIMNQQIRGNVSIYDLEGFYIGVGKGIYIKIKQELIPNGTIEELLLLLQNTDATIEYELAEEEIEPYTEEQQEAYNKLQNVLSYKTVTNVFTNQGLLEFKYVADTQTWTVNLVKSEIANTNQQVLNLAGGN